MKDQPHLISTKINQPAIGKGFVCRERILKQLIDDNLKSLTLFSAPAGYGKSTTISQWLGSEGIKSVWISLDEDDNDLNLFVEYLCYGLNKVFPDQFNILHELVKKSILPPVRVLAGTLINLFNGLEEPVTIVLDDYHLIVNNDVHSFIDACLTHPSDKVHLVISTRRDPPLKMKKLRLYEKMNEFRMSDLAFDEEETAELFSVLLKKNISRQNLINSLNTTEGWAVGLKLLFQSIDNEGELRELIKNYGDNIHHISEFLLDEVIDKQSPQVQDTLLVTCLFKRFNREIVKLFLDKQRKYIELSLNLEDFNKIIDSNLFIIPLDENNSWFRYHHLFQDLLLKQLKKRKSKTEINRIHEQACGWFEKNEYFDEALHHAIAADNFELAADIFDRNRATIINADQMRYMEKWLVLIPNHIYEKRASLLQINSVVAQYRYDLEKLMIYTEQAGLLYDHESKRSELYGEWCYQKGWVLLLLEGKVEESVEFFEKALELLPEYPVGLVRAESELMQALSMGMLGRSEEVFEIIEKRLLFIEASNKAIFERLIYAKVAIYLMNGDLYNAKIEAIRFSNYTADESNLNVKFWASWFLGVIAFQSFDLKEAKKNFKQVIDVQFIAEDRSVIDSFIALAIINHFLGDKEELEMILEQAEEYVNWSNNPEHFSILNAGKARLNLLRGEKSLVSEWLVHYKDPAHLPSMLFFVAHPALDECRALLNQGDVDSLTQLDTLLYGYQKEMKAVNNYFQYIEVKAMMIVSSYKQNKTDEAILMLRELLTQTKSSGWIRPYVELGSPMKILLEMLLKENFEADFVSKIVKAMEQVSTQLNGIDSIATVINSTSRKTPLTFSVREIEILELVAQGFRNKEIAHMLFIAENTVKKHVYNMFKKFDVKNRITLIEKSKYEGVLQEGE